jgi:predicted phosphoribosyltransferase
MKASKSFTWYTAHGEELAQFAGKHIAIVDDGVAAVADTAYEAYKLAKEKHPTEEPALTYIPKADVLVL